MQRMEALLLCDLIVIGPDRKLQLQGIFDTVMVKSLPAQHQRAWIYFRFYPEREHPDGGAYELRFQLLRPDGTHETMPAMRAEPDQNGKIEGFLEMRGVPLLQEGEHRFELFVDGERTGYCRFEVRRIPISASAEGKQNVTIQ
jgi:hypothetical protein